MIRPKFDIIPCMERQFTKEFYYSDGKFEYTPPGWTKVKNLWYPLGFKVVTNENISLGLRKNPTPLYFPIHEWVKIKKEDLIFSNDDAGGIWSALKRSGADTLKKYMMDQYNKPTTIYLTALFNPVFANSYRVKSQGVMLLEKLK